MRHALRVAVDGITASGKTTLATELAAEVRRLGRACQHVSMDGFHQPRAHRYRQGRESADGYYEDAYDFAALRSRLLDCVGPDGDNQYRTAVIDLASDRPVDVSPRACVPGLIVVVDGSFLQRHELRGAWDVIVFVRVGFATSRARGVARDAAALGSTGDTERLYDVRYHAAQRRYLEECDPEANADIVIDNDNLAAPTIVRVVPELTHLEPHLRRTRAFFAPRAATWDEQFPDDDAAFLDAVRRLAPTHGGIAVDLGCGTGRALPFLREAVGADGLVIGVDATPEMLNEARAAGGAATLVLADVTQLPVRAGCVDSIFAAGLLTHVPAPGAFLRALASASKPGGRLALFHPIGRAALAQRHNRTLRPDEVLDPRVLPHLLAMNGWQLEMLDDAETRYLAIALRRTTL